MQLLEPLLVFLKKKKQNKKNYWWSTIYSVRLGSAFYASQQTIFALSGFRALFTDPQIFFFNKTFIKNGSHGTIHTFKNYFTTVFLVFSFQFQQNKFYPNRPLVQLKFLSFKVIIQILILLRRLS